MIYLSFSSRCCFMILRATALFRILLSSYVAAASIWRSLPLSLFELDLFVAGSLTPCDVMLYPFLFLLHPPFVIPFDSIPYAISCDPLRYLLYFSTIGEASCAYRVPNTCRYSSRNYPRLSSVVQLSSSDLCWLLFFTCDLPGSPD